VDVTKSDDYQCNAEECQRMADTAPTDREKRSWMKLAEHKFEAILKEKGTSQKRSDKSN
jgi:hypothetical protein